MPSITHTARFRPDDPLPRILEDFACPACGEHDPGNAFPSITGPEVRLFCDGCGTFVTILLSDEQAEAIVRRDIVPRHGARPS